MARQDNDLLTACRLGGSALDSDFVSGLLSQGGVDVNAADDTAWTAVHWCTRNGATQALKVLCEAAGADVNRADKFSTTPLHLACRDGRDECCQILLTCGAHVNCKTEDQLTPLHLAAKEGWTRVIEALAAARPPVPGAASEQIQHAPAASNDATPPTESAAPAEESPSTATESADTAATPVEASPPATQVPALPAYDPSGPLRLEERDAKGLTALQWACMRNKADAVAALIRLGCNVECCDPDGKTCLMVASELGAVECQEHLIAAGADLDAQARNGRTAAIFASKEGRSDALRCLVLAGAGVTGPRDADGNTALSLSSHKVIHSLVDADPSRLFLNDRNHWKCFTACISGLSNRATLDWCMGRHGGNIQG